jgi:hypothetical protein
MNDLRPYDSNESLLPDLANPYDDQYDKVASVGGLLPRLQLFISSSEMVKTEKIGQNRYGLVTGKDQITDLGKEVDVLILTWRPRALDTSDRSNIRASSDINSDLFKDIQEKAGEQNSGCLYGPEFLLYVPMAEKFATCLFGSKTARNEARSVQAFIGKPATFKSRLIKTNEYSWQAMMIVGCSTPFDIPTKQVMQEVCEEFLHPKEVSGAEKAEVVTTRIR